MLERISMKEPFVLLRIQELLFAIPGESVKTMVAMPHTFDLPHKSDYVRGMINLRGEVIAMLDLRKRLGLVSYIDEITGLVNLMAERERDHKNWLQSLEKSIKENTEFTLATDPHKCAFGKWFDNYDAKTVTINTFLKSFNEPHRKIHDIATKSLSLKKTQSTESALALIEKTRNNELSKMIDLFSKFRDLIHEMRELEIALVLEVDSKKTALAVDSIEAVELLKDKSLAPVPDLIAQFDCTLVSHFAKRKVTDEIVFILNENNLLFEKAG